MTQFSRLLSRISVLTVVAAALMLSACHSEVKSSAATAKFEKAFPLTVKSYKSGQFMLDGAVLSPLDLGSHFAYLRDQDKLPKRVLLVRSEDTKIHKSHLMSMARMQLDYGFAVYYDKKGQLVQLKVTDGKDVPQLRDHSKNAPLPDEMKGKTALDGSQFPTGQRLR